MNYVPAGKTSGESLDAAGVCAELKQSETAFKAMTGRGFDGIWRAPDGRAALAWFSDPEGNCLMLSQHA